MTDPTPSDRLREYLEHIHHEAESRGYKSVTLSIQTVAKIAQEMRLIKDRAFLLDQVKEAERIAGALLAERDAARADADRLAQALRGLDRHNLNCGFYRDLISDCDCPQRDRAALADHDKAKDGRK